MQGRGANCASPLLVSPFLLTISDQGHLSCLDSGTGEMVWHQRLPGQYFGSPVAVGRLAFVSSNDGVTTVLETGRRFQSVATNRVEGRTFASLAPIEGRLYLRTEAALSCLGREDQEP